MKTLSLKYVQMQNCGFCRISSDNGAFVREIKMSDGHYYRGLRNHLSMFYNDERVEILFEKGFPIEHKEALEELVVIHNASLKD